MGKRRGGTKRKTKICQKEEKKIDLNTIEDVQKTESPERISQLPHEVIHHIFSFLPPKQVVATRILSRTWRGDSPVQRFNQFVFANSLDEIGDKFLDFVDDSLQNFCKQKENVRSFSLHMQHYLEEFAPRINKWLELTADNDFHELYIHFGNNHPRYSLPESVFASKFLTVLNLHTCELKAAYIISSESDARKLDSLQELSLENVHLSDAKLNWLISITPSIVIFSLKLCKGVTFLQLCRLTRLKKVVVQEEAGERDWIEWIEIEAPSLRTFEFHGRSDKACNIDLKRCKESENLSFHATVLPLSFSCKLFLDFSVLGRLFLLGHDNLRRLEILSPSLELLKIDFMDFAEIWVDFTIVTPHLRSLEYISYDFGPFLSEMMKARSLQETKLEFLNLDIDASWFVKLRAFIRKLSHIEVLSLIVPGEARPQFNLDELRKIRVPPAYRVKHLKLEVKRYFSSSSCKALLDGILWSSHPETLTMELGEEQDIFIKVLLNELNYRKKDQKKCCKSSHIKCWRHDLKGVEIEEFTGSSNKKPMARLKKITFRFKW